MYYERKVEPSPQSQMTSFPLQWEMGSKFLSSLPSAWLKGERVGVRENPGTLPHRRYSGVPFRRVPDNSDHSTQAFLAKKQPSPSVTSHLPCPSSSLPFQGLLSSLLSFVKSITRKGKKKKKELQWNKTKTFNNFDIGAQHLYLSPRGPGWGRAGWPFSTGSAFAPRCRKRAKEKPSP